MTREEAIKEMIRAYDVLDFSCHMDNRRKEAFNMAKVVLEQEPSGDLINRQAVMDCFKKWQPYIATRLWDFEQELSKLPPVDPQTKTGRWIEHFDESGKWYECDQCHTDWGGAVNYCPNCGAKMVEPQERSE